MDLECECSMCNLPFNRGSRCPRVLQCAHTFCESCLRAIVQSLRWWAEIRCPLCHSITLIASGPEQLPHQLQVDTGILDLMESEGLLKEEEAVETAQEAVEEEGAGAAARDEPGEEEREREVIVEPWPRYLQVVVRVFRNFLEMLGMPEVRVPDCPPEEHE